MGMIAEFKEFALKGSLIDMAVGIILGAAIGSLVGALVDSVLMPVIGIFMGGIDFSSLSVTVGDAAIGYGAFIQALIDFLIISFVIFMILRMINSMKKKEAEAPAEPPADIALLTEIRDLLNKG
ncbi:MAG: large-conductance mechanosensitive channel protein MscL [Granulosicoccus sp.]